MTTFNFFLHGYTGPGGPRVRPRVKTYFCSSSGRGTIFGSEKLFRIFSEKKIFWTISTFFLAYTPKNEFLSSPQSFTREFSLICPLHDITHKSATFKFDFFLEIYFFQNEIQKKSLCKLMKHNHYFSV